MWAGKTELCQEVTEQASKIRFIFSIIKRKKRIKCFCIQADANLGGRLHNKCRWPERVHYKAECSISLNKS